MVPWFLVEPTSVRCSPWTPACSRLLCRTSCCHSSPITGMLCPFYINTNIKQPLSSSSSSSFDNLTVVWFGLNETLKRWLWTLAVLLLCMISRAKKVIINLTLVALIASIINFVCLHHIGLLSQSAIITITFHVIAPIINAIVVREVRRRASSDAASNLWIQHHQPTSSNSAVPTVMLVITSLIYVLLNCTPTFTGIAYWTLKVDVFCKLIVIATRLLSLAHTYNFYVYLITGKHFRSELYKLYCSNCHCLSSCFRFPSFCSCFCLYCFRSSSSSVAAAANDDVQVARRV